jgi:nucleoside phosphorylase
MIDSKEYLPKSRTFFRKFMKAHYVDLFGDMKEARVGPGTGYGYYYRSNEVTQHIRDIVHNLGETFGDVSIPDKFSSPKNLVKAWQWFYEFLQNAEVSLFGDIFKKLNEDNTSFSEPLILVYRHHQAVLGLLEEILSMEEVKAQLEESPPQIPINDKFDIVIVTALFDTEFEALKKIPVEWKQYFSIGDNTHYLEGKIGTKNVLLATDDKMGIAAATGLSTKVIAKFKPQYLIMAGIAAGVKDNEKDYGDIMVARFTWNYESGKHKYDMKSKKSVFEPSPEQIEMHDSLVHIINDAKSDDQMLNWIYESFDTTDRTNSKPTRTPKIFMGPMATGSAVLADKGKIDSIRKNNRKLIGIDMETFGVFYSVKTFSNLNETKAISIKSISDFADYRKNDRYRNYAAHTSARFIYSLIKTKL